MSERQEESEASDPQGTTPVNNPPANVPDGTAAAAHRPSSPGLSSTARLLARLLIVLLLLTPVVLIWWTGRSGDTAARLARGRELFATGDLKQAAGVAATILADQPDSEPALLLAGEVAAQQGETATALESLNRIGDSGTADAVRARYLAATLLLNVRQQPTSAEGHLRRALQMNPADPLSNDLLAYLLGFQSRYYEMVPFRLRAISLLPPQSTPLFSLLLGENAIENPETVLQLQSQAGDDPGVLVAASRVRFELKQYEQAAQLAQTARAMQPGWPAAAVRLGQALLESGDETRFAAWHHSLTDSDRTSPSVWYVLGTHEDRAGRKETAARCLWECVRRDPGHQRACYLLGQLLNGLGRTDAAQPLLERARRLEACTRSAEVAHHLQDAAACLKASRQAEELGLLHESLGWARLAARLSPGLSTALERVAQLTPTTRNLPWTRMRDDSSPVGTLALNDLPLPADEDSTQHGPQTGSNLPAADSSGIRFEDRAKQAGLDFRYFNAGQPTETGLVYMYEVVGGGAAVLDFDQDGLPDLHFSQGGDWPQDPAQREHLDRLFRNTGDGRFVDATTDSLLLEPGFSQGAAAGDMNADGFPDLYVAGVGGNRLFRNNGDGTWTDITAETGTAGSGNTASALVADINGDGLPDIYEVNYLAGDDLFTRVCGDNSGVRASCLPHLFPPDPDRLYLNLGDGRFEDITESSGVGRVAGKGLGVLAWTAAETGEPVLFVANDVGPNFLLVNTAPPGQRPEFTEQGITSGLALNRHGRQESSMGIAAGDVDGDGLLDLFVTNFDDETNTLYRQQGGLLFDDATLQAGLSEKRQPYVGWGAQFLDADLDGHPDLLLTNGHVNDMRRQNRPFQMPAQFFRNLGEARFQELPAESLGEFFSRELLGRGMARLDWNRDGREDVVISHLDAPAALLTGMSHATGHFLAVQLRGVSRNRDAIGATVTITAGGRTHVRQLTAGDGNQASNERRLVFGLGPATSVTELQIHWPGGATQSFTDLPVDSSWLAIEHRAALLPVDSTEHPPIPATTPAATPQPAP